MKPESTNANKADSADHSGVTSSREALWHQLQALLAKTQRTGLESLADSEVDALGRLYRAATTHLSLLKEFGASARQKSELNTLVAQAHRLIYARQRKGSHFRDVALLCLGFPESVRRLWRHHVLALLLLVLGAVYGFLGSQRDLDWALEFVHPSDERTPFATREELFETLMEGRPRAAPEAPEDDPSRSRKEMRSANKSLFAAFLWRHNTTIAVQSFFSGFLLGIPTILILIQNGAVLGVYSQTFHSRDLAFEWWAWILPHGITELLAVVLLSGGGLYIAHRILVPGELSRFDSLNSAKGDALRHLLFAFPMLLLAAILESFVRQSGLSDAARYVFAGGTALLWAAFLGFGRIPNRTIERIEASKTIAERAVLLPGNEEILSAFRLPRGR